jgi:hypothetical protein
MRMAKEEQRRAEREARKIAHDHTQWDEGRWIGDASRDHPIVQELFKRWEQAAPGLRACPHLQADRDQAQFWVESVPKLLACRRCMPVVAAKEKAQALTLCLMCRRHVKLRGISVAVSGILMRCGICGDCETKYGGLEQ